MSGKEGLYLLAVVPPVELAKSIDKMRVEFADNFHCYKALRPPVHLTLNMPFKVQEALMEQSIESIGRLVGSHAPFSIELKNFGFFESRNHPVLYINVVKNMPLKQLNDELGILMRGVFQLDNPGGDHFRPHFTLGYRDTTADMLPAMKAAYANRSFSAAFEVASVRLFRHSGARWEIYQDFSMEQADSFGLARG